ncbi:Transcription factor spt20 [Actinomortierella ambigua]|nr:Transcription factor spt20 [Actinomortierella ambigua]
MVTAIDARHSSQPKGSTPLTIILPTTPASAVSAAGHHGHHGDRPPHTPKSAGPKSPKAARMPNGTASGSSTPGGKKSHARLSSTTSSKGSNGTLSSSLVAGDLLPLHDWNSLDLGMSTDMSIDQSPLSAEFTDGPRGTKRRHKLLDRYKDSPASIVLHLYETHFKFENQDGVFLFNSPMKIFLKCIQEQRLPAGLLDIIKNAQCSYYEGRLIVEVVDHRTRNRKKRVNNKQEESTVNGVEEGSQPAAGTQTKRVVLSPSQETLWADLSLLHEESRQTWSNELALEVESQILLATEAPLCLDPSPQVTLLSNNMNYHQTSVTHRTRKKRKWNSVEREREAARKIEEDKLMSMMDEKSLVDFQPSFSRLAFLKEWRAKKKQEETQTIPVLDPKKSKAKRQEMAQLPDGRKLVRTIRFEVDDKKRNYKMYYLFNIIQNPDASFEAVMRYGTQPDSSVGGGMRRFHLGPEQCADMYALSLKTIYFSASSLISDTTPTSTNTAARANAAAAAAVQAAQQAGPLNAIGTVQQ